MNRMLFLMLLFYIIICNIGYSLDSHKLMTQYIYDNWQISEGLPQNSVLSILQTKDGYIWFGTEEGLVRFDGFSFVIYTKDTTPELKHNNILFLYEDTEGNLWIGTRGGGVTVKNGNLFKYYSTENGLNNNMVFTICEDQLHNIWIGTRGGGLTKFNNEQIINITKKDGLSDDSISALYVDKKNNLWIGTRDQGINVYNNNTFSYYNMSTGLCNNSINVIYEDSENNIWIGTNGSGINKIKDDNITHYDMKDGLSNNMVFSIIEDKNHNIFIGTRGGGINRFYNGRFEHLNSNTGLSSDMVKSIFEDKENNLWIGTYGGGLSKLKDGKFTNLTTKEGLSGDVIFSIYKDSHDNLWIGTQGNGLNQIKDGHITQYSTKNGLSNDSIMAIYEDSKKGLWIGTQGGGANYFKDGKIKKYSTKDGLNNDSIIAITEDEDKNICFGTYGGGVCKFDGKKFSSITKKDGLSSDMVICIHKDSENNLWIGTRGGGINRIKDNKIEQFTTKNGLSTDQLIAIYEDGEHTLWFGTQGGGLLRYKDETFSSFSKKEGLYDDVVFSILEDSYNNLWLSSNKGIFRINKNDIRKYEEKQIPKIPNTIYGIPDGMKTQECNGGSSPSAWATKNSNGIINALYFSTIKGVCYIDPNNIKSNDIYPDIHIDELIINGTRFNNKDNVSLDYDQNNISFKFTACSYTYPKSIKFKYMLEGYDKNWLNGDYTRRIAEYTNLPFGEYNFKVIACNNDGLWNEKGAEFSFIIRPAFTQTFWFYSLCGLFIFILGYTIYRLRVAQLKANERKLQIRVEEQTLEIRQEKENAERLLLNILPQEIADELKIKGIVEPIDYSLISVIFADLVGFTQISERMTPKELVSELDKYFDYFDSLTERYKLEKLKTIGDGYMCAGGIPISNKTNPIDCVLCALEIQSFMNQTKEIKSSLGLPFWELRLGIHTGPVVAGVIGKKKFSYDIWGDTVNTASRMESSGEPGKINISEVTYNLVKDFFDCEYRGKVEAKNKGMIDMFFIKGIKKELSINNEFYIPNESFKNRYSKLLN